MTWAWKQNLPSGPKFVLLALADNANSDGLCYPGQDSLADKCGMTERTVRNAIKVLQESGIVTKQHRQKQAGKGRTSDLYQIMIPGAEPLHQPEKISALNDNDQQENISGRKPVDNLQDKPEEFSGRNSTNRKIFPNQPENISGSSNKEVEPSVEPSVYPTLPAREGIDLLLPHAMYAAWTPCVDSLKTHLQIMGVPSLIADAEEACGDFISYWLTQDKKLTHEQWTQRFAKELKLMQARSAKPKPSTKPSNHRNFEKQDYGAGIGDDGRF